MATPVIAKSASAELLLPAVEDEVKLFLASDAENN